MGYRYDYKVHPVAESLPMMPRRRVRKVEAGHWEKFGLLEPIVLDRTDEVLLDGRNRLKACKEAWHRA